MKTIILTQSQSTIVDDDFEYLNNFKWRAMKQKHTFYACRTIKSEGRNKTVLMHRIILNIPKGMEGDHVDGNGLNNQKTNLRTATVSQNRGNHVRKNPNSTSKFKGVSWNSRHKKWVATIQINKNPIWLGTHINEFDAAKIYDAAAIKYFKEFASPNFPV